MSSNSVYCNPNPLFGIIPLYSLAFILHLRVCLVEYGGCTQSCSIFSQVQKRSSLKMKALGSSSCLPSSACGRRPSLPLFSVCLCVLGLRCPCNKLTIYASAC